MEITVPGDKSISHRALLLAALAEGESRLSGLLSGEDTKATAAILRTLGVRVPPLPTGVATGAEIRIRGVGLRGLGGGGTTAGRGTAPTGSSTHGSSRPGPGPLHATLDCGNSGTTARLLMGLLSGTPIEATLDGDASLRSRPMRRVTLPLSQMGARFEELGEPDRLPIRVLGGSLRPIDYDLPVASAQVKSALLLAGLTGGAFVLLTEPGRSRDHTERMLRLAGVSVLSFPAPQEPARGKGGRTDASAPGEGAGGERAAEAWRVELRDPPERLLPLDFRVPGDFSSAAFPLGFALLGGVTGAAGASGAPGELVLRGIGLNTTRTGLLAVLERMGADIEIENFVSGGVPGEKGHRDVGEPTADLVVRPGALRGTDVGADDIPGLVDEIPVLAALAARARGITRITGAGELRVKESDRLSALAGNLRALGVVVEELPDGLEIEGSDRPLEGRVRSFHDHRIAMAFGVLGALPGNRIEIEGRDVVDVSYPGFWQMLATLRRRSP